MLESTEDYNELWAVSETGAWIGRHEALSAFTKNRNDESPPSGRKPIRLLAAFDPESDEPHEVMDGLVEVERLPWGRHNRHMTIVCKNGQPRAAIYFVRRLRAPTVTPVFLSDQQDLKRITEAFEKLWEEAEEYSGKRETSAPPLPQARAGSGNGKAKQGSSPTGNGRAARSGGRPQSTAGRN
jgi:hypothetical protein